MSLKEIKWGIIGCGDVTEVKSGPAFNKIKNSSLVAVMRRDAAKAEDYAKRHGVPTWYINADDLINDTEVNAIYIATPPGSHEEYTLKAIASGKPVYVEKPMTLNAESAKRMTEAANGSGIKLTIAHYRRAQPMFLKIKKLIDEAVIGDIRFVKLEMYQSSTNELIAKSDEDWRRNPEVSGGGLFHDLAPHQLDLMYYFFGEIESFSGLELNQARLSAADDFVTRQIKFKNGVVFNGTWCFTVAAADQNDVCEIYGSQGKISFSIFGNTVTVSVREKKENIVFDSIPHVEQPMIEKVVNYFLEQGPNPCPPEDGVLSMILLDGR
ncbi:Gfo/Idh/MocA family protein [Pedobacter sp. BMA]|uniref:Gfo/Idh/MocA family protein n=1 Tax=Pedobacter sp. BMA TaxID=1663685 RepID=UPI00064B099C|nr:Gfo/Idh/MocA family oxidoreductase [Pedobacter sp. BMA]KLT63688.1 oxidoreductase [Pedobacter sp. BMA]